MGWAKQYIEALSENKSISFRPHGNSMSGKIESGNLCTLNPVDDTGLNIGDIVLCRVNGSEYLHLIKAKNEKQERYQIGNNKGKINGWVKKSAIFGKCVKVET